MNWEAVGAVGEIVGAIAVLITLAYLALQVRQNTAALRSAATQGAHDQVGDLYRILSTDSEMAMIFVRGCTNPDELSDIETAKYFSFLIHTMFYLQNWYTQTCEELMDDELLSSWTKVLTDIAGTPGFQRFWGQRQHLFSSAFREYLEANVFSKEGDPQYKPLGVQT